MTANGHDPMRAGLSAANLFNIHGGIVDTIGVPEPRPSIVIYGGVYFHLENGRYVQATVWHHHQVSPF